MTKTINRLSLAAALTAALASCGPRYDVSGTWEDGEGKTVYLYEETAVQDSLALADSAQVAADGTFALKGRLDYPKKMIFSYDGKKRPVFAGDGPVIASISLKDGGAKDRNGNPLYECSISAGREQSVLESGEDFSLSNSLLELGSMMMLGKAYEEGNKEHIDSITTGIQMMKDRFNQTISEYLDTTRDDIAVTYFISSFMLKNRPVGEVRSAYDSLSARVRDSRQGQELLAKIGKASQAVVGGIPDDFTLPSADGGTVSLSQFRGHYVILDFWASWCKPCLQEAPNVKAIYEKHHGHGLEVLGVSMDDDGDKWRKAIEDNGLVWSNVSSLKGWNCPVAHQFNVTAIPRMFILDPQGRIIDQDLRGEALAARIDGLYGTADME